MMVNSRDERMVIGVCGFTSTGSSVVSDFLKEFDENCVLDGFEFVLPYFPDGLDDLRYHLCDVSFKYLSSNAAIYRFRKYISGQKRGGLNKKINGQLVEITERYLEQIVQAKWRGYGAVDGVLNYSLWYRYVGSSIMARRVIPKIEKVIAKNPDVYPVRDMEFAINPDNFDALTRRYVMQILEAAGAEEKKNIILDQPFPGNYPQKVFDFFENPVAIVVDRDPRDNYLFAKKFLLHKGRSIPSDNVQDFVVYYKKMRENMPYKEDDRRILRLSMESMIYDYEETTQKVMQFCGLKEWNRPKKIFDPALSVNNTQVFKRYPEYKEEINYIENELSEYLFPFEKYGEIDTSGSMFYGKSPLNKN